MCGIYVLVVSEVFGELFFYGTWSMCFSIELAYRHISALELVSQHAKSNWKQIPITARAPSAHKICTSKRTSFDLVHLRNNIEHSHTNISTTVERYHHRPNKATSVNNQVPPKWHSPSSERPTRQGPAMPKIKQQSTRTERPESNTIPQAQNT